MPTPFTLRHLDSAVSPALISDLVRIFHNARQARLQFLIDLHTAAEDAAFITQRLLPENTVWIAEVDRSPAGFVAISNGWVNQLYIDPAHQGRGIGTALLNIAKSASPTLQLWVFESNTPAIDFYLRRGFTVAQRTNGASNEARLPDLRMTWQDRSPGKYPDHPR